MYTRLILGRTELSFLILFKKEKREGLRIKYTVAKNWHNHR